MTSFKSELTEIIALLKSNQKELRELKSTTAMSIENISNIYQTTADLSRKFDEMVNVTGIKQPVKKENSNSSEQKSKSDPETPRSKSKPETKSKATKSKTVEKKKKLHGNIMTYFRTKFLADQTYFYSVMKLEDTEALFTEHEKELKSKKGDKKLKAQVALLYKAISADKAKLNVMRNMMDKENNEHMKSEGAEASKDDTEDEDGSDSGVESDSEHDD
jgi:hypothetical protein